MMKTLVYRNSHNDPLIQDEPIFFYPLKMWNSSQNKNGEPIHNNDVNAFIKLTQKRHEHLVHCMHTLQNRAHIYCKTSV